LADIEGNPYPGFSFEECQMIHGDSTAHPVVWKGDIAALRGEPVRFEFRMKNVQLYGFDVIAADNGPLVPLR
jgi:hypothetical protein